jgi:hypothetical protein
MTAVTWFRARRTVQRVAGVVSDQHASDQPVAGRFYDEQVGALELCELVQTASDGRPIRCRAA